MADPKEDLEQITEESDSSKSEERLDSPGAKKSVRTTFKLTKKSLGLVDDLSDYWDVSKKELLDVVAGEVEDVLQERPGVASFGGGMREESETQRKTMVVSRGTRNLLNEMAEEHEVARDDLLELGIHLLQLLKEKQTEKHEALLQDINDFYQQGRELENKIRDELGTGDPVRDGFSRVMLSLETLIGEMEEAIEAGESIDTDMI